MAAILSRPQCVKIESSIAVNVNIPLVRPGRRGGVLDSNIIFLVIEVYSPYIWAFMITKLQLIEKYNHHLPHVIFIYVMRLLSRFFVSSIHILEQYKAEYWGRLLKMR